MPPNYAMPPQQIATQQMPQQAQYQIPTGAQQQTQMYPPQTAPHQSVNIFFVLVF